MEATWQVYPAPHARAETNTNFFFRVCLVSLGQKEALETR